MTDRIKHFLTDILALNRTVSIVLLSVLFFGLGEQLWSPFLPVYLEARSRTSADPVVAQVSWAALPMGDRGYLVESGPCVHYLSSERDLVPRRDAVAPASGLLALGGPAFDEPSLFAALAPRHRESESTGIRSSYRGSRSSCGDFRSVRFEPLPAS